MPCTGLPIATAGISCLDFKVAIDISGASPIVTITNNSAVAIPSNLKWWFYITSPSAVPIYGVDLEGLSVYPTPDYNGVAFTAKTFVLPTPFGNPPCGQVEFSPNSPYTFTVFVVDSAASSTLNTYTKNAIVVRPQGNKSSTCGSFGVAKVSIPKVDCAARTIMCVDSTNLAYNSILTPSTTSNTWTLVYPQDDNGDIPNSTASNVPSVSFPVSVNSKGYTLYFQEYATYDYGDNVTVKVQYKLYDKDGGLGASMAINCNTNLCALHCQLDKLRKLADAPCGDLKNPALMNKLTILGAIMQEILIGIFQPLCGIDVPALIEEWKRVGEFADGCDCGCDDTGDFGFSNPTGGGSGGGGSCCPVIVDILDYTTGDPVSCVASYFPVQVYNPTYTAIIGVANNVAELAGIINSNAAWQAYGTAFPIDLCQVGFYTLPGVGNPPDVKVVSGGGGSGCVNGAQNYQVQIKDVCYPTSTLITAASFPFNLYINFGLGAGPQFVANVSSQAAMISALNAFSGKPTAVTFSAGATVDQIIVNNTDCASYSGTITISADVSSSSYLLYTPDHYYMAGGQMDTKTQQVIMSIASLSVLGKIAGPSGDTAGYWHSIKFFQYLLTTEPSTGKVFVFDLTNPLIPTTFATIQLTTIDADNFTGDPQTPTYYTSLISPPASIPSYYSLYFPTDYNGSTGFVYVVESTTGTIWRITPDGGVLGGFQDDRFIGKCPRVYLNGKLYFTQDGSLESDSGQSSGVAVGDIVVFNVASFSGAGISTETIFLNHVENVWAAAYDGVSKIYFVGEKSSIGVYDIASASTTRYLYVAGASLQMLSRCNAKFYLNRLYVTPMHMGSFDGLIIDTTTLGGSVSIREFDQPPTNNMDGLFNFMPLNNCTGILTAANLPGRFAYIGLYQLDGTYLAEIPQLQDYTDYYNVIPIPAVANTTPNNYIPL